MKKVLVLDNIAQAGVEILKKEGFDVDVKSDLSPEELLAIIGQYSAMAVRSKTKVTRAVLEAGQYLQVVGRAGVGVDNIDIQAATERGVIVVNAPTGNNIAAAEHTVALMMAMARNIPEGDASLKAGEWKKAKLVGIEVRNKVLGIIGLGKIGTLVAKRAKGLDMEVISYDPYVTPEHAEKLGVRLVDMNTLLAESDFITVHTPLTANTKGLIGAKQLSKVKKGVRLLNVARGGIIDEAALLAALDDGRVAGAAIDVFSKEPPLDNPLVKHEKVICTPHLGASTKEAQINVAVDVAEQIVDVLQGRPARYALNAPRILPEELSMLAPYMTLAEKLGSFFTQMTGELKSGKIELTFAGEIAQHDTTPLRAAAIKGLLEPVSSEQVNLVNAALVAQNHGLSIVEQKTTAIQNFANLITIKVGDNQVSGTTLEGEPRIVQINPYWVDVVPSGYLFLSDHLDRPGIIGAVGTILGNANINISFMQVGRITARGKAIMVLNVDEPLPPEVIDQLLTIPDIYTAKMVKMNE